MNVSPFFTRGAVGDRNDRANHDIVAFQFASVLRMNAHRAVLVQHDEVVSVLWTTSKSLKRTIPSFFALMMVA